MTLVTCLNIFSEKSQTIKLKFDVFSCILVSVYSFVNAIVKIDLCCNAVVSFEILYQSSNV